MGWSCTGRANDTLKKITKACLAQTGQQNVWRYRGEKYFYELPEKEHTDGSIRGEIVAWNRGAVGRYHIDPQGNLIRGGFGMKDLLKEPKPPKERRRPRNPAGIPRWSPYYPGRRGGRCQ